MNLLDQSSSTARALSQSTPEMHIKYGDNYLILVYRFASKTIGIVYRPNEGKLPLITEDKSYNQSRTDEVLFTILKALKKVPHGQIKSIRSHLPPDFKKYHVGGNFYRVPEYKLRDL